MCYTLPMPAEFTPGKDIVSVARNGLETPLVGVSADGRSPAIGITRPPWHREKLPKRSRRRPNGFQENMIDWRVSETPVQEQTYASLLEGAPLDIRQLIAHYAFLHR